MSQLNEASLSRLQSKIQKHVSGTITGYRGENTRAKNQKNNKEIVVYLQGKGYSVTKVKGSYIENKGSADEKEVGEASFIVVNHKVEGDDGGQLEKDLVRLGKRFDQDSILVIPVGGKGAYLRGTSKRDNAFPNFDQKIEVGKGKFGDASGEFFSRINGRKFAFESVEELTPPSTINGLWGQKLFVEQVEAEDDV